MPQIAYPQNMSPAFAGMKADSGEDLVHSAAAIEVIPFGALGVFDRADNRCALPRANVLIITEDGGTFTAGAITTVVNGVTVTTAWGASKAATMTAHAADIQALAFVATAVSAAPLLTITPVAGVGIWECVMDFAAVTGTMAAATYVGQVTELYKGLALAQAKEYGSSRRSWNDRAVLQLAGDALNAGDLINATVNGVAMGVVTYAVSEANTLQLICNALQAIPGVRSATPNAGLRQIVLVTNPGLELVVRMPITDAVLAAVAPTFTPTYTQQADPIAVAETAYLPAETVSVMRRGRAYCRAEEALVFGDPVFVRVNPSANGTQRGALRNDVDGGSCFAVAGAIRFAGPTVTAPDGTLVVPVEINLP